MENEKNILYDWNEAKEIITNIVPKIIDKQTEILEQDIDNPLPKDKEEEIKNIGFGEEPRDPEEVIKQMNDLLYKYSTQQHHPKFFSFIPLALSPVSVVGEVINSIYSPYGGSHVLSEGIATAQKWMLNWMGENIGYSVKELGGLFVSGGSMANLTASVIARNEKLKDEEILKGTVYISDQTHSSVAKGFHIMGVPRANIRKIETDEKFKIKPNVLRELIKKDIEDGYIPFLIVGTAGTTNTGAIDPLNELADIAEEYNVWLHVDGAYGATGVLSSYKDLYSGIERSDSVSWDGHKWLFQTYGCAAIICKDRLAMTRTFNANPEYLSDVAAGDSKVNFWDIGIELTSPARGMRLWYTLQRVGQKGIRKAVDTGFESAKYFEELFKKEGYFEIVSEAMLSCINVRYYNEKYSDEKLNEINQKLSQMATDRNKSIYYTTELRGKKVLRFCAIHPLLSKEDIKTVVEELKEDIKTLNLK
ncbi:MAG: aminotransferase class I/II-fold pyridoxal phosphate-dependent enzyme [Lagierella massiliensis]|nr:aminotransferase class I/II-fold pyridoxal phosphate-dependent enzyme [Lagierella massiliensis]